MTSIEELRIRQRTWLRFAVSMLVLVAAAMFGGVFLFASARNVLNSQEWWQLAHDHFPAVVGLPSAALAALIIVLFLEVKSGRIEFEAWGLRVRGAAGEAFLFVVVFLAISLAIKMLW